MRLCGGQGSRSPFPGCWCSMSPHPRSYRTKTARKTTEEKLPTSQREHCCNVIPQRPSQKNAKMVTKAQGLNDQPQSELNQILQQYVSTNTKYYQSYQNDCLAMTHTCGNFCSILYLSLLIYTELQGQDQHSRQKDHNPISHEEHRPFDMLQRRSTVTR